MVVLKLNSHKKKMIAPIIITIIVVFQQVTKIARALALVFFMLPFTVAIIKLY